VSCGNLFLSPLAWCCWVVQAVFAWLFLLQVQSFVLNPGGVEGVTDRVSAYFYSTCSIIMLPGGGRCCPCVSSARSAAAAAWRCSARHRCA